MRYFSTKLQRPPVVVFVPSSNELQKAWDSASTTTASPIPCCVTVWARAIGGALLLWGHCWAFLCHLLSPGSECWTGKNLSLGTFAPSGSQRDHGVQTCCICPMCYQQTTNSSMDAQLCSTGTHGERSKRALRPLFPSQLVSEVIFSKFFRHTVAALKQVGNVGTGRKACTAWAINFKGKREG